MARVLLAGDLGARDPGDDALLSAFAHELPRWEIVVSSTDPTAAARRLRRPTVAAASPLELARVLRRTDVLVLGDAALRALDWPGRRGRDLLALALAAKAAGRRLVLLGVGADRLRRRSERVRAQLLVRAADLLVLRDAAAADALASGGAPGPFRVGADPAWCALPGARPRPRPREGVLVVLDARFAERRPWVADHLASALDRVAVHGLRVRLAPWQISRFGADDLDLARAVSARVGARARVLLPPADLDEACAVAASAQVVLALRLHALIVAATAGTPAVPFGDGADLAALGARLGAPALPAGGDPEQLAARILAAAHAGAPDLDAIDRERAAAREGFRLLRLLIDGERSTEDHDLIPLPLAPDPQRWAG
ncbi:MAG TPA: polysaccharide pyruvyl transferase family protein [Solirubrobacteraceae bacterium]|jgi:polysaccharide pyruvyl transferase WcaK-like protein|nr:polysaccharide pyruvyl transferase family protein [Solirubrobacteraceae bacterium]